MRSIKLEYLRFDNPKGGILIAGKPYLIMRDSDPVEAKICPYDQEPLLDDLFNLRYNNDQKDEDRQAIISNLSKELKKFFAEIKHRGKNPVQIDLVLNANELGLLPFELILDKQKSPLFASRDKPRILTRRIRQNYFISKGENWPTIPRVLFASANPNYGSFNDVPYKDHRDSLKWALRNWIDDTSGEESSKTLDILEDVSFNSLSETLISANNSEKHGGKKEIEPYTHLHILAHGTLIDHERMPNRSEYGVALYSETEKPTRFKEITDLLGSLENKPFVVSYMICDGANSINPTSHERNIVQVTHEKGVPIVLGSQLPLTFPGSIQITNDFYNGLFNGEDVRNAIHEVRCNLYKNQKSHDWLSFVTYVRLPEGYEDYLNENSLKRDLAALKNINKKSEAIIKSNSADSDDFEEMIHSLKERIDILIKRFKKVDKQKIRQGVFEENAGLLGSAHKRWAELIFNRDKIFNKEASLSFKEQEPILKKAATWYKKASNYNLSNHWSVVQYLSLQTILNPKFNRQNYWCAAMQAARNDARKKDEIWAYGSLAELYLLSPDGDKQIKYKKISEAIKKLVSRSKKANKGFPIESTLKQFERYANWWTRKNGYNIQENFIDMKELNKVIKLMK